MQSTILSAPGVKALAKAIVTADLDIPLRRTYFYTQFLGWAQSTQRSRDLH